ncbi:MAG: transglycosylase SLT domain-containing protein [Terracidiphilus sp.]
MRAAVSLSSPSRLSRWLAGMLAALLVVAPIPGYSSVDTTTRSSKTPASKVKAAKTSAKSHSVRRHSRHPGTRASRIKRTARIHQAFIVSAELRPMAQQLATLRSPAAYLGVTNYAHRHTGEAAAAAYLALGHAYLLDHRYNDAEESFKEARKAGDALADYADYLAAQAYHDGGNQAAAEALLKGFNDRYPDSIFDDQAPELDANTLLALNDLPGAQKALEADSDDEDRPAHQLAEAQIEFQLGHTDEAGSDFRKLLLAHPLTPEAQVARDKLKAMGAISTLSTAELRSLGDAYYNAGRYEDAAEQYRALTRTPGIDNVTRGGFEIAAAACELKLKRLTKPEAEALPQTQDENGARRLYLLMELARNRDDLQDQQSLVTEMETSFPNSQWLAEALFSSGNMYMLRRDYPGATAYYGYLAMHFPQCKNAAAAHWRAGWLSYRQGQYTEAARIFDEQIKLYPTNEQTAAALYWRGRLYETQDREPAKAAANYRAIVRTYQHYFYAQMARERLTALGVAPAEEPQLDGFKPIPVPHLDDSFPTDSPHLAKARLLANAGLNDYIAQEIAADPNSSSWSALAEAQIYASYGETFRAMRALKRALPYATSASIKSIPLPYWRILYPEPYWETIKAESAKNNLDPYLVASLIRQESEFNPSAVSYANAWGLMQLLPAVGKQLAREEGIRNFQTYQLLDPETNIRLGTRYLRQTLDHFGGEEEYALAAYNAGDERVADWQSAGPYHGIDEFVESIPFTQTREYVEAILRNIETYREIDQYAGAKTGARLSAQR